MPWLLRYPDSASRGYELAWHLGTELNILARMVRGNKMRRATALFEEFGAAMQFPDYFGANWPALGECLSDLSWMPGKAYAVVVTRAEQVLREEPIEMLGLLADLFAKVASTWAVSIRKGEAWGRPEVPFHFVLQVAPQNNDEFSSRWGALGVDIGEITRSN